MITICGTSWFLRIAQPGPRRPPALPGQVADENPLAKNSPNGMSGLRDQVADGSATCPQDGFTPAAHGPLSRTFPDGPRQMEIVIILLNS